MDGNMLIDEMIDKIFCMDCLEGMKQIPDGTIDAVICDLPYGTTACAWFIWEKGFKGNPEIHWFN